MTSEFVFFSSNPSLNHTNIEKCLLLFATNTNIFTLLFKELKTNGKSFIFAVCRLTYDHVTSNLISLILIKLAKRFSGSIRPVTSALVSIFKATKLAQFSSQTKKKVSKCPIWERSKNEFLTVLHYLLNRYEKIFQTISEISCCFG